MIKTHKLHPMAHSQQNEFCKKIRYSLPRYFRNTKALEIGSLDINGNNNHLFEKNCNLFKIDLGAGKNVDLVCHGADLDHPDGAYEVIISTEAFEHDNRLEETLRNIVRLLSKGGLFLFTCAGEGRPEHGTKQHLAFASPHTLDFYQNRSEADIRKLIDIDETFRLYKFETNANPQDLYFWGIKF